MGGRFGNRHPSRLYAEGRDLVVRDVPPKFRSPPLVSGEANGPLVFRNCRLLGFLRQPLTWRAQLRSLTFEGCVLLQGSYGLDGSPGEMVRCLTVRHPS